MSHAPYRGFRLVWDSQRNAFEPRFAGDNNVSAVTQLGGYFADHESFRRAVDIYRDSKPHLSVSR